jgi:hypothetical protein
MATKTAEFHTNPNKDFLRRTFDRDLVERWFHATKHPLQYLGLPGWEMLDIIEWQAFLDRFTTIERLENQQHLMFLRANVKDVEHRLYSLYGSFDDILLTGRDAYGHTPQWPYDIVNLDFFGGLLYSDLARPRALKKLIENQSGYQRSFLLFVTHDLRDADKAREKVSFLADFWKRLRRDHGEDRIDDSALDWYALDTTPDSARQALYTNVFLRDTGENAQFNVTCRSPIIYTGTGGTKMIHYATDFLYEKSAHRAVSSQSLMALCNLGVREVIDGKRIESAYDVPDVKCPTP